MPKLDSLTKIVRINSLTKKKILHPSDCIHHSKRDFSLCFVIIMSRDKLGSNQTIILHNCLNKHERYTLVFTTELKNKQKDIHKKRQQ